MLKKKKQTEAAESPKSSTIIPFPKRIQTAEGWKRSQLKKRTPTKTSNKK